MPKLSPEERAALEQQLADDDADDDDFEFHYGEGDRTISIPWSRRHDLAEFGFKGGPKRPPAGTGRGGGTGGAGGGGGGDGGDGKGKTGPSPLFGTRQPRRGATG